MARQATGRVIRRRTIKDDANDNAMTTDKTTDETLTLAMAMTIDDMRAIVTPRRVAESIVKRLEDYVESYSERGSGRRRNTIVVEFPAWVDECDVLSVMVDECLMPREARAEVEVDENDDDERDGDCDKDDAGGGDRVDGDDSDAGVGKARGKGRAGTGAKAKVRAKASVNVSEYEIDYREGQGRKYFVFTSVKKARG